MKNEKWKENTWEREGKKEEKNVERLNIKERGKEINKERKNSKKRKNEKKEGKRGWDEGSGKKINIRKKLKEETIKKSKVGK